MRAEREKDVSSHEIRVRTDSMMKPEEWRKLPLVVAPIT